MSSKDANAGNDETAGENANGDGLSDDDVARALADYEQDFADMDAAVDGTEATGKPDPKAPHASKDAANKADQKAAEARRDAAANRGPDASFGDGLDDQLRGILGEESKQAVLVTGLRNPDLLAAVCLMAQVDADCLGMRTGAIAVLRDRAGQGPEDAAKRFTTVVAGMTAVLIVNRADRLEAHAWVNGVEGAQIAPPVLLANLDENVEDLVISQMTVDMLREDGPKVFSTDDLTAEQAIDIIHRALRK